MQQAAAQPSAYQGQQARPQQAQAADPSPATQAPATEKAASAAGTSAPAMSHASQRRFIRAMRGTVNMLTTVAAIAAVVREGLDEEEARLQEGGAPAKRSARGNAPKGASASSNAQDVDASQKTAAQAAPRETTYVAGSASPVQPAAAEPVQPAQVQPPAAQFAPPAPAPHASATFQQQAPVVQQPAYQPAAPGYVTIADYAQVPQAAPAAPQQGATSAQPVAQQQGVPGPAVTPFQQPAQPAVQQPAPASAPVQQPSSVAVPAAPSAQQMATPRQPMPSQAAPSQQPTTQQPATQQTAPLQPAPIQQPAPQQAASTSGVQPAAEAPQQGEPNLYEQSLDWANVPLDDLLANMPSFAQAPANSIQHLYYTAFMAALRAEEQAERAARASESIAQLREQMHAEGKTPSRDDLPSLVPQVEAPQADASASVGAAATSPAGTAADLPGAPEAAASVSGGAGVSHEGASVPAESVTPATENGGAGQARVADGGPAEAAQAEAAQADAAENPGAAIDSPADGTPAGEQAAGEQAVDASSPEGEGGASAQAPASGSDEAAAATEAASGPTPPLPVGASPANQSPTLDGLYEELTQERKKGRFLRALRSTMGVLIVVAAIAVLVATLITPVLEITGSSMTPTLHDGQYVVSIKGGAFSTGDVIAFYYNNKVLVKRVIAGPGDWVDIDRYGNVSVNGEELDEPYLTDKALGECDIDLPYQVPDDRYFVMGDHRSTSVDSRSSTIGCVSEEQIVGDIAWRIWPLSEFGPVE